MERILLINPAQTYYKKSLRVSAQGSIGLPLHILYIAAVLEKKGRLVKIVDSLVSDYTKMERSEGCVRYGIPDSVLSDILRKFKPDMVGINSQFTAQEENVFKTAELVRHVDNSILVIVGGANVSCRGRRLLEDGNIDIAVKSEGEKTICEIADSYRGKGKKGLEQIKGILYRKGKEIIDTGARPFIQNLDDIPFPAYHLVDMETYLTLYKKGIYIRDRDVKRNISMITSRGCPYGCIFCSISQNMGKKWRAHSAGYVVEHIEKLWKEYGIKHVHFEDDNLLFDLGRFVPIMDALSRRDITWDTPNGIRVDPSVEEEMLDKMRLSGCKSLTIGVESGDEYILKNIVKKDIRLTDVEEFAKRCRRVRLPLRAFFILGFPGETMETMRHTVNFALRLLNEYGVEIINLIATPLYGTELYNICKENNYFLKEITPRALSESTVPDGHCLINTESASSGDVERMSRMFTARVYRMMLLKGFRHPVSSFRRIGNMYTFNRTIERIFSLG